jgi:uncharacterized protein YegL
MDNNLTEIVCILDRSGSMSSQLGGGNQFSGFDVAHQEGAISGYNSFIESQKQEPGDCNLTVILFDDQYEILHDCVNIQNVPMITKEIWKARGYTGLYDAIGKTINVVGDRLAKTDEEKRPSKVIFYIVTDGGENSSTEFSQEKINEMVTHQRDVYSWAFIFASADPTAEKTAKSMGISSNNVMMFSADAASNSKMYMNVSSVMSKTRSMSSVDYSASLDGLLSEDEKNAKL